MERQFYHCDFGYFCCEAYAGQSTSYGSENPRTELRELDSVGTTELEWDGSDTNVMNWKVQVLELPSSGEPCFGQVHETTDTYDDIIRVQFEGKPNQSSGDAKKNIMGWVTEDDPEYTGDSYVTGTFALGTTMDLSLSFTNNVVNFVQNNDASSTTLFTSASEIHSPKESLEE